MAHAIANPKPSDYGITTKTAVEMAMDQSTRKTRARTRNQSRTHTNHIDVLKLIETLNKLAIGSSKVRNLWEPHEVIPWLNFQISQLSTEEPDIPKLQCQILEQQGRMEDMELKFGACIRNCPFDSFHSYLSYLIPFILILIPFILILSHSILRYPDPTISKASKLLKLTRGRTDGSFCTKEEPQG